MTRESLSLKTLAPLGDRLLAALHHVNDLQPAVGPKKLREAIANRLRPVVYQAVRFDIGDDVTEAAAKLSIEHPSVLLDMVKRVRAPFPRMIFEWNNHVQLNVTNSLIDETSPLKVACLIEQPNPERATIEVTLFSPPWSGGTPTSIVFEPLSFVFDAEDQTGLDVDGILRVAIGMADRETKNLFGKRADDGLTVILMGGAYARASQNSDEAGLDALRQIAKMATIRINNYTGRLIREAMKDNYEQAINRGGENIKITGQALAKEIIENTAKEFVGAFRQVVALLALINAKDRIVGWSDPWAPKGSLLARGRVRPFMSHRTVRLLLPLENALLSVSPAYAGSTLPRRRHGVIGHWCSSAKRGRSDCEHLYVDLDVDHKECSKCQHLVWWRHAHQRGDASIGFVTQDYSVRKRKSS